MLCNDGGDNCIWLPLSLKEGRGNFEAQPSLPKSLCHQRVPLCLSIVNRLQCMVQGLLLVLCLRGNSPPSSPGCSLHDFMRVSGGSGMDTTAVCNYPPLTVYPGIASSRRGEGLCLLLLAANSLNRSLGLLLILKEGIECLWYRKDQGLGLGCAEPLSV